jgi:hypothetical protein
MSVYLSHINKNLGMYLDLARMTFSSFSRLHY